MMNLRNQLVDLGIPVPEQIPIDEWATALTTQPCRNTMALVGLSAMVFYAAEKNHNPKVNDFWDALIYTSTCISVGYADIFARTPVGKIIGSALMTVGPAMAAKTLDGPANNNPEQMQEKILGALNGILAELKAHPRPEAEANRGEVDGEGPAL